MKNALKALQVIDRLEVGPPVVEKDRITAPYLVRQNGEESVSYLTYRYEQPVFQPGSPECANLAAMILAQVAINYGLFCKEILFRGKFSRLDQEFLDEAIENTATEIYVNKILKPNPFIQPPFNDLPREPLERYAHCKIRFADDDHADTGVWESAATRCAVLSSGGKDSLLTFGALSELGFDTHALYGNESGRHWFTALNAYRAFREIYPNTGRVWMNSDRIFVWMLRRLPFIRQDFARTRADIYPIRLWTVAVFLFGVLPILRQRGIGNLLIGSEFDTTTIADYHGIKHYDGLYDQSRIFDEALSSYFTGKHWNIQQFSILRPLSELLILRILAERYPDLQAQQVSCHAAHEKDGRIYPCGACEKCRRVVGMLTALGIDAGHCGYTEEQIRRCLLAFQSKGAHLEETALQQVMEMLAARKSIEGPLNVRSGPIEDDLLKLCFHPMRSPLDQIPEAIRPGLLKIYLDHADGILLYKNSKWAELDAVKDRRIMDSLYVR